MLETSLKYVYLFFSLSFVCPHEDKTTTSTTPEPDEKIEFEDLEPLILCKFQPNAHDCDGTGKFTPKFYFDLKMEDCKTFNIGTCPQNLNAYSSLSDCHRTCQDSGTQIIMRNLSAQIFCRLQPDFGQCNDYHPRWYFDMTTRRCKGFSYSGCGGNLNRFSSQQSCTTACNYAIKTKS